MVSEVLVGACVTLLRAIGSARVPSLNTRGSGSDRDCRSLAPTASMHLRHAPGSGATDAARGPGT